MNKKQRALIIKDILDKFYPDPKIPLTHSSPYTLLIAVLLSAQCTDNRVNLVTPKLFKLANTPEAMISLKVEEIAEIIKSCGLVNRKAKAIFELSRQLIEKHGSQVPCSFKDLEDLPGVGHKTASVIMASIFHEPAFPVDTHIHRLAKRWKLSSGKNVKTTEADLKKVFNKKDWNRLHLQIIYFAREYCKALAHNANTCPICSLFTCK